MSQLPLIPFFSLYKCCKIPHSRPYVESFPSMHTKRPGKVVMVGSKTAYDLALDLPKHGCWAHFSGQIIASLGEGIP